MYVTEDVCMHSPTKPVMGIQVIHVTVDSAVSFY